VEQFGYGFGFTAYMLYMIYISEGTHKTSHYAIATGFMALGMMIPGMFSGWIQETIGYKLFFIWVVVATIPAFIITKFIKIDPLFGIKKNDD
jgi:PAT family beta-lactamase induction signal transducer AmpG